MTTPEERIKLAIGDLHFQIAFLSARLDETLARLAKLEPRPDIPHTGNGADRDARPNENAPAA
jgi:hypothetical protein